MQNNVEEIKARINIVDLVGEYVRLTKAGTNWKGLCPFHHEKSPSFMVNEEKQFFHCFGCNKGGDAFAFVMEIESLGFREALKLLAEKTGVQLEQYDAKESENKNKSFEILELATKFYENQLWNGIGKNKILPYLHERALTDESIKEFRVGYAPDGWDNIIKFLMSRGYDIIDIEKTGLVVKKEGNNFQAPISNNQTISNDQISNNQTSVNTSRYYDRFRDRVMFPIFDTLGKIIGYSARVAPGGDESQAKYINTPETGIYHKSRALYGIHLAKNDIKQKNFTLLVEGQMDVIASHQAGLKNTVAASGTALTEQQIDTLKRYGQSIKMLFDMDSAGQKAAERSADLCFQKDVPVLMVTLSGGKDAAEVAAKDPQQLVEAVEKSLPAMEYFFQAALKKHAKGSPDDKKAVAGEVLAHVANFSNEIERAHWVKKLAQELEVEEKVIIGVLSSTTTGREPSRERQDDVIEQPSAFKKRPDIIRDRIAGLVMSDENLWKNGEQFFVPGGPLGEDKLIGYILAKGTACGYSFDELLVRTDSDKAREYLQKIYFEAKFKFDNDQNIIEYDQKEKEELLGEYIKEFGRELQKQQLSSIIKDIRIAEQSGDKEKLKTLVSEFTKLSQELA